MKRIEQQHICAKCGNKIASYQGTLVTIHKKCLPIVPEPPPEGTVKANIEQYLRDNGYDGLWNPHVPCGCLMSEGGPISCCDNPFDCEPGYRFECPGGEDCYHDYDLGPHWFVGPEPPKPKEPEVPDE